MSKEGSQILTEAVSHNFELSCVWQDKTVIRMKLLSKVKSHSQLILSYFSQIDPLSCKCCVIPGGVPGTL